jgi:ankyrin repeat protein
LTICTLICTFPQLHEGEKGCYLRAQATCSAIRAQTYDLLNVDPSRTDEEIDVTLDWDAAIRWAAETGHAADVELLLRNKRVNPGACYNVAIVCAAANGHLAVVELLLHDERVDPSATRNYAFFLAAKHGYVNIVKLLLQDRRMNPAETMENGSCALVAAANAGQTAVVELLLRDSRVRPTAANAPIASAAFYAIQTDMFMRDGKVTPVNPAFGNYIFQDAAGKGHDAAVELLLQDDNVNPVAHNNRALGLAASRGHTSVVNVLLRDIRVLSTYHVSRIIVAKVMERMSVEVIDAMRLSAMTRRLHAIWLHSVYSTSGPEDA